MSCLRFTDVRSLWPLRSADYIKRYTLTLIKSPESILIDGCMVHEYILTIICCDKTKTLLLVKPFYCSLCHEIPLIPDPLFGKTGVSVCVFLKMEIIIYELLTY